MEKCPCGLELSYSNCCEPLLKGEREPVSAEALMRSRYSAYVAGNIDYIKDTTHPDKRGDFDMKSTTDWAEKSVWYGLEIVEIQDGKEDDTEGQVEFIAHYMRKEVRHKHHERAEFKKDEGRWFFVDGEPVVPKTVVRQNPKTGRNEPCPCGSGKKYKKCCLA